jgi:rubrerythrin
MNYLLLNDTVKKSGLKKKFIAECMNISNYTLGMKLSGARKFNIDEVAELCRILSISEEKRNAIFFNNLVENISTKRKED